MLVAGVCHKGPSLPHHLFTGFTSLPVIIYEPLRCSMLRPLNRLIRVKNSGLGAFRIRLHPS